MNKKEEKTHYLFCPIDPAAAAKVQEAITILRAEPENPKAAQRAVDAVIAINECSLDFYFVQPLDKMKVNAIGRGIVKMGVQAGVGVLKTFGPQLVKILNTKQLVALADVLESVLVELDPGSDLLHSS